jgi:hypothetical protein
MTGLIGAALAYIYTSIGRLPSHALTMLPAGVQVAKVGKLSCDEAQFLSEVVNNYLTDEIAVPGCDEALTGERLPHLVGELERARVFWKSDRLDFFDTVLTQLADIKKAPSADAKGTGRRVRDVVSQMKYIASELPSDREGPALLDWAIKRVDAIKQDATGDYNRLKALVDAFSDPRKGRVTPKFLNISFVATNTSDIEFYLPVRCMLILPTPMVMSATLVRTSSLDDAEGLAYVPLLPGRGQIMKFKAAIPSAQVDAVLRALHAKGLSELRCSLPDGKLNTRFEISQFLAEPIAP